MTVVAPTKNLGPDLRVLRKQRGLTLSHVASSVGRSVGWLSQVERNLSVPSIDELSDLARVLKVSLSTFISRSSDQSPEARHVVRKDARRPVVRHVDGLIEELLSPDLTDDFEVVHSTFLPGAERKDTGRRPTHEVGYVVSGRLEITIGEHSFNLSPGDSFRIRGETFRWANHSSDPCIVIWVIAPPVY